MSPRGDPYRPEMPIVAELAAGVVLVHETEGDLLLLHQRDEDRWCLPKGHVDPGESLMTTALRETREESGLARVELSKELGEVSYRFYRPKDRVNVFKSVVYFLAFTPERTVRPEPIFDRYEWVSLSGALERVAFDTDRQILYAARDLLSRTKTR
jgi:8-oxo-dGTP pyrophosphatase MutT (NUDIX family)